MFLLKKKTSLPSAAEALPGRAERMPIPAKHFVLGTPLDGDFLGMKLAMFGMGCVWGAER
ncbi:MAG: peptide-methionine (S)-S-oxide reductase, partial [Sandaracinaceae bacterium]|nr:peptide-methionine (S)-S-oxide reductase [Sandaracinaceae bacterium]